MPAEPKVAIVGVWVVVVCTVEVTVVALIVVVSVDVPNVSCSFELMEMNGMVTTPSMSGYLRGVDYRQKP